MSAHSCNQLCRLHERFHVIQKYEMESEIADLSPSEMREHLMGEIKERLDLIELLK